MMVNANVVAFLTRIVGNTIFMGYLMEMKKLSSRVKKVSIIPIINSE